MSGAPEKTIVCSRCARRRQPGEPLEDRHGYLWFDAGGHVEHDYDLNNWLVIQPSEWLCPRCLRSGEYRSEVHLRRRWRFTDPDMGRVLDRIERAAW